MRRALLVLGLASVAAPAIAQLGGRRRGGRSPDANTEKGASAPALEVTMHELHEDLKLTAEQGPLWQAYEERLRALGNDMAREGSERAAQIPLVQRIDHAVDVARDRMTALEDIGQAAKALYAKLTPEQQKAADPRLATLMLLPLTGAGAGDVSGARRG
jgi:hypothetical protein